jgi:hypothetical protein
MTRDIRQVVFSARFAPLFSAYFPQIKVLLKTVFKVRSGLQRLSQRIIGSNTLIQGRCLAS